MGHLTQRVFKECFIELFDCRVLMRLPQGLNRAVIMVERLGTKRSFLIAGGEGLPSASHATPWTGHDLNEVVVGRSVQDAIHEPSCVGQAMSYGNANLTQPANLQRGFLHPFKSPDGQDVETGQTLSCYDSIDRP